MAATLCGCADARIVGVPPGEMDDVRKVGVSPGENMVARKTGVSPGETDDMI